MQTLTVPTRENKPINGAAMTYWDIAAVVEKKHGKKCCAQTVMNAEKSALAKIYNELIKKFPELGVLGPARSSPG